MSELTYTTTTCEYCSRTAVEQCDDCDTYLCDRCLCDCSDDLVSELTYEDPAGAW